MSKYVSSFLAVALMLTAPGAFAAARVAVLHAAPFSSDLEATAVNIAINGTVVYEGVKFKGFADYTELDAGDYTVDIILAGDTEPVLSEVFTLMDGVDYTVAAIGNGSTQPLELRATVDDNSVPADGNVAIRVSHLAPFASELADTEVSIRTAGGDVVNDLVGVPYKVDSGFFEVPADTYDLKVASNDGMVNYIDPLPAPLPAGANVTIYAVGDAINQPLAIIAFPVGELPLRTPVDNSANGWWNIMEGSGQGFITQPIPAQNRLVGTWYTYDEMGAPLFLTFDSCFDDSDGCSTPGGFDGQMAETVLLLSTGGGSSGESEVTTERIGTIMFEFDGCFDAMATVTMDADGMSEMFTGQRLTLPIPCTSDN